VETGEGTAYDGPWVTDVLPEEVINSYKGWEPDLLQLLEVGLAALNPILMFIINRLIILSFSV